MHNSRQLECRARRATPCPLLQMERRYVDFVTDLTGAAEIAEKQRDAEDANEKHKHFDVLTFHH